MKYVLGYLKSFAICNQFIIGESENIKENLSYFDNDRR